jgi:hypothetical protein
MSLLNEAIAQTKELRRSVAQRLYPQLIAEASPPQSPMAPQSPQPQSLAEAMYPQLPNERSNGHVQ